MIRLTAILLLTSFVAINAQELDDDYYFRRRQREKKAQEIDLQQVTKYTPTQMFTGELLFGYERKIDAKSSWEAQLGPTLSEIWPLNNSFHLDYFGVSSKRESGLGLSISGAYRYYPSDYYEALQGFYVSPMLKYRLYNYGFSTDVPGLDRKSGSKNELYFTFNFGKQIWLAKTFAIDTYIGMGIGYRSESSYYLDGTYDYITGEYNYEWKQDYESYPSYYFTTGVKVGIGK